VFQQSISRVQGSIQQINEVICWSCMKVIGQREGNKLYKLGDCCADNSYTQLSSFNPQLVQETLW
jgi:hypothetical protein